jgi:hypothetical protein
VQSSAHGNTSLIGRASETIETWPVLNGKRPFRAGYGGDSRATSRRVFPQSDNDTEKDDLELNRVKDLGGAYGGSPNAPANS